MSKKRHLFSRIFEERRRRSKRSFLVFSILRGLVIATMIRSLFTQNYESAALCILALMLFLLPAYAEDKLKVDIPPLFEVLIYLFIYAACVLGEIKNLYVRVPGWDTMLHTVNGFLCAAVGFSLVDILNQSNSRIQLSPFYLALGAFCFSMTIGVVWEIIEFTMDSLFAFDMQKDYVINQIASVTLDPTNQNRAVVVTDILRTEIQMVAGESVVIEGGYLDIGLIDTMKDLIVNLIGAASFSVLGYFRVKNRNGRHGIVDDLMILPEQVDGGKSP